MLIRPRHFGYILSLNPASDRLWRELIAKHSDEILPDQLHDEDGPLFETEMVTKFQRRVEAILTYHREYSTCPPKLIEICPDSWTSIPTAILERDF